MQFKVGDRVISLKNMWCDTGEEGTVVYTSDTHATVEFDNAVAGHNGLGRGKEGHCWYMSNKEITLIEPEMPKTKRVFTNSQKIRLRLKVYFDANDTGYDEFEEFYTAFTDALLENIEFIASMFIK